ncbi:MAG: antibiotic biosynthesis monooxygenase [Actinomycetota bacterium]
MNTIHAQFRIVEGKEAEAEAAIKTMAAAVEANETGTLAYIFHRNKKDPAEVSVWEVYEDDAAAATHTGSQHMAAFGRHFGPLFDPTTVKITRLDRVAGFKR